MGLSKRWTSGSYSKPTAHNKNAGSSCAVEATAWSGLSGESSIARERDELVFRKTVLAAHIEYKEGNFFLYSAGARTSSRASILDDVGCPLPRRNRQDNKIG